MRDGDKSYFDGMGVNKAIQNVNTGIAERLMGQDAADQEKIDNILIDLDGTPNKGRLGGNAIIAASIATAKAAARSKDIELFEYFGGGREIPLSLVIVMFGGPVHVGVEGTTDFQEYALYDLSAKSIKEGFVRTINVYQLLREYMVKKQGFGIPRLAQMAGWLSAKFSSNDEALSVLARLVKNAGYVPGKDFGLYLDIAATHLYKDGKYHLKSDNKVLSPDEWIDMIVNMYDEYPVIVALEDCLYEDDWEGWQKLTKKLGDKVQLVGDDFFVTNPARLKKGIEMGCANTLIIKPNQVGTLTETFEAIKLAKSAGYATVLSARSGQVYDPFMAHLCVGQSLGQCKMIEAPNGVMHLNEILRIQGALGDKAVYRGKNVLARVPDRVGRI